MKSALVLLSGLVLATAQRPTCNPTQFYSSNRGVCVGKKQPNQYCNVVQTCMSGSACMNSRCTASDIAPGMVYEYSNPNTGACNVAFGAAAPSSCCTDMPTPVTPGCKDVGYQMDCQMGGGTPGVETIVCNNGGYYCDMEDGQFKGNFGCLQGCSRCEQKTGPVSTGVCYRGRSSFFMAGSNSCVNRCGPGTVRTGDGSCMALKTRDNILIGSALKEPVVYESAQGVLDVYLTFAMGTYEDAYFTCPDGARLYDDETVGATWRVNPGDKLNVHFMNALEPDEEIVHVNHTNILIGVNTTNLHTHGLHVSARQPEDDVLVEIDGGQSFEYKFIIHEMHMPGHHWYHPHRHGASAFHTAHAYGSIIINEGQGVYGFTNLPQYLAQMRKIIFTIANPGFEPVRDDVIANEYANKFETMNNVRRITKANYLAKGIDAPLNPCNPKFPGAEKIPYVLVNGQHLPFIRMYTGEPVELMLLGAEWNVQHNVTIEGCTQHLMSKDGIHLYDAPRPIRSAILPPGARAGVVVLCPEAGDHGIYDDTYEPALLIASLKVAERGMYSKFSPEVTADMLTALAPLAVNWPWYLEDLTEKPLSDFKRNTLAYAVTDPAPYGTDPLNADEYPWVKEEVLYTAFDDIEAWGGPTFKSWFSINLIMFTHHTPMASFMLDDLVQTTLSGPDSHPHHQHVNPFQYFSSVPDENGVVDPEDRYANWYLVGDWHDTFQMSTYSDPFLGDLHRGAEIRWKVADFDNEVMVCHCHILIHEDHGMMTWYAVGDPSAPNSNADYVPHPQYGHQTGNDAGTVGR
jgi:FtsP/CotA-like multicopper oxidase with cupredoxin domain